MSTLVSESNPVGKCGAKIVDEKEAKETNRNGLLNGLVHNKKHKKNKIYKNEAIGTCEDIRNSSSEQNHVDSQQEDIVNNVVNCKKKSKKKRSKEKLDSNENFNEHKLRENCHVKCQNQSLNDETSLVVNDLKTSPSCSKTSINVDEDICETHLTGDIEKLVIRNEDNFEKIKGKQCDRKIEFVQYESELQMPMIMKIIQKDLSEPYSIYTYRYFIHNWPKLCFLAMCEDHCVGAIVCKLDLHRKVVRRGYIAMLAVDQNYRKLRIGSTLVQMAIHEMTLGDADEVVLETEVTNKPALKLYEKLGFVRDKRLFRYYLNGVDALRLKLWLR